MMDYPETSGNLRKPAAEVSEFFIVIILIQILFNRKIRKPAETFTAGYRRFPDNP
jgi:hypothetical protein